MHVSLKAHTADIHVHVRTIISRNFSVVRFYFKDVFNAAGIRGRLDFEGSIYGD